MADEATAQAKAWLAGFEAALARGDTAAAGACFGGDGMWRDLVAFTWNIVTLEGPDAIAAMLGEVLARLRPVGFTLRETATVEGDVTAAWFDFETAVARGRGHVRLKGGKAWTFFTAMRELKGHEERSGPTREEGVIHGAVKGGRQTWLERREAIEDLHSPPSAERAARLSRPWPHAESVRPVALTRGWRRVPIASWDSTDVSTETATDTASSRIARLENDLGYEPEPVEGGLPVIRKVLIKPPVLERLSHPPDARTFFNTHRQNVTS